MDPTPDPNIPEPNRRNSDGLPASSAGDCRGGASGLSGSIGDARLADKALSLGWPVTDAMRSLVVEAMGKVIADENRSVRAKTAAARVLIQANGQTLEAIRVAKIVGDDGGRAEGLIDPAAADAALAAALGEGGTS